MTAPVLASIVATPVFDELHTIVPVAVVAKSLIVSPIHTAFVPVIGGALGSEFSISTIPVRVALVQPLTTILASA